MRRRVFCHGRFRDIVPEVIEIEAETAAEAINGLVQQFKALGKPTFTDGKLERPVAKVFGFDTPESLTEKSDVRDLHIVPAFSGQKSPLVQVLIGGLLIATAVFAGPAIIGALGPTVGALATNALFMLGVGAVLGGVTQLLFPSRA